MKKERENSNDDSIEASMNDSRFNTRNIVGTVNETKAKPRYELRAATS